MAILFHINVIFEDEVVDLFPPSLRNGTAFYDRSLAMNFTRNAQFDLDSPLRTYLVICHIFPNQDTLNNFCSNFMTDSEKLVMKEWKELNKIKITYHTYDLPESTIPAPAIFG